MASSSNRVQLLRRAQRLAQVQHPSLTPMMQLAGGAGLVPVANQGRRLSDSTPGGTFKRFAPEQVARLLCDVLRGLGALHEDVENGVGFVHGEVSPQHIFVTADGTARLVPVLPRHWAPKVLPLSNGYTAPELLLGDRGDPRADVFSVGAMLWEALAGVPLCPDASLDAVLERLLRSHAPRLLQPAGSSWAPGLSAVAERAIAVDRKRRFQTAAEMLDAIELAMLEQPVAVPEPSQRLPPPLPSGFAPHSRSVTPFSSSMNLKPEAEELLDPNAALLSALTAPVVELPPRRGAWLLLGGVTAVAVALALVWLSPRSSPSATAAAEALPLAPGSPVAPIATPEPVTELSAAPATSAVVSPAAASAAQAAPKSRPRRRDAQPRSNDYGI